MEQGKYYMVVSGYTCPKCLTINGEKLLYQMEYKPMRIMYMDRYCKCGYSQSSSVYLTMRNVTRKVFKPEPILRRG